MGWLQHLRDHNTGPTGKLPVESVCWWQGIAEAELHLVSWFPGFCTVSLGVQGCSLRQHWWCAWYEQVLYVQLAGVYLTVCKVGNSSMD